MTDEQIGLLTTDPRWSHMETPVLAEFARVVEAIVTAECAQKLRDDPKHTAIVSYWEAADWLARHARHAGENAGADAGAVADKERG